MLTRLVLRRRNKNFVKLGQITNVSSSVLWLRICRSCCCSWLQWVDITIDLEQKWEEWVSIISSQLWALFSRRKVKDKGLNDWSSQPWLFSQWHRKWWRPDADSDPAPDFPEASRRQHQSPLLSHQPRWIFCILVKVFFYFVD